MVSNDGRGLVVTFGVAVLSVLGARLVAVVESYVGGGRF